MENEIENENIFINNICKIDAGYIKYEKQEGRLLDLHQKKQNKLLLMIKMTII